MNRSDEPGPSRRVVQRLANLAYQNGQVRLGDERRRPEPFLQVGLRDRVGAILEEEPAKIERLRRQVPLLVLAKQLARIRIDPEFGKPHLHAGLLLWILV